MGRVMCVGVLAAALCLASAPLAADAAKGELKLAEIKDSSNELGALAIQRIYAQASPPAGMRSPPSKATSTTTYFKNRIGETDLLMAMDYSNSASKLYIDTNGDGDLSNERPLVARKAPGDRQVFPAMPIKGPGGAKVIIKMEAASAATILVYPGAMVAGTIELEGKSFRVYVADGNLNGTYDDGFSGSTASASFDTFGIDMNGNGRFDSVVDGCSEVMPLPKMVRIGGVYFTVTVAADGKSIEMDKTEPGVGTVEAGTSDGDLTFWSENGAYRLCGTAKCEMPAGHYIPVGVRMVKKDSGGATWTLEGNMGGKLGPFDVKAGETTALNMGTPLVCKVDISRQDADNLSLGFGLYGSADEPYGATAYRNGRAQPLPRYRIVDQSGKVIKSGTWTYG